jgi:hypothetical protein
MKKVLLTLGDSWPEGAELGSGKRYGELLQEQMSFDEFYNYGRGGTSNEHMITQLQTYFQQHHRPDHRTTAIFFLTNPHRTAYWPRDSSFNVHGAERQHWNDEAKQMFMKTWLHFHTDEVTILRSSLAITTLQKWCRDSGIDDYYFSGWVKYPVWLPTVDVEKIWAQGKETAGDWFGASDHNGETLCNVENNQYIRPNFAHPNQLGHQLIAEKLQSWIQSDSKDLDFCSKTSLKGRALMALTQPGKY